MTPIVQHHERTMLLIMFFRLGGETTSPSFLVQRGGVNLTFPPLMQSNLDLNGDLSSEISIYAFVRQNKDVTSGMQRDRACIHDSIFQKYHLYFSCSSLLCQAVLN